MRSYIILKWSILSLSMLLSLSCSSTSYREIYPILADGKYDSEFPYRGCSAQLEKISESVRMISCIAYYKSYIFSPEAKIRLSNLQYPLLKEKAIKEVFLNRTSSGSATTIYSENKRIALLTCAHVVDFSDTIITYYRGENRKETEFIQSLAVKDRQSNYVASIQGARDLEVLAIDKGSDLAVVGQRMYEQSAQNVTVFNYPFGKAKELEWGTFVYLFGYPAGYQMITKGIVSSPNRDKHGSFLTDAVSNRGFSGGIVLAIRDGVPNFELVGMATLVPARQQYFMTPFKEGEIFDFELDAPFKGDVYVESRSDIIYGIAPAISSELIVDFLEKNQQQLQEKGYDIRSFLERKPTLKQEPR
ncbi:MAG: serine protease [Bacteroidota bacterium]